MSVTTRTDSAVAPIGTRATRPTRAPLLALLGANAISLAGSMLTYLALPWFVLATTGSPALTGLTATCQAVAAVVAAIGGGALVDRLGHARTSVVADMASGALVATIPTLSHTVGLAFWQLLALVFARSLCDTPGGTARSALLPDAAARAGLAPERANAWFQAIQRGARLLGAPLAGVLIAVLGPSPVLWIDAATFFASAAIVAGARPAHAPAAPPDPEPEGRYLGRVAIGLRFIRRDRVLLALVSTLSLLNGLESPLYGVILPVYARRTFGSALDLGLLMAGVGGGATVGALVFGALGPRLPRRAAPPSSVRSSCSGCPSGCWRWRRRWP